MMMNPQKKNLYNNVCSFRDALEIMLMIEESKKTDERLIKLLAKLLNCAQDCKENLENHY